MLRDDIAVEVLKVLLAEALQHDRENDVLVNGLGLERDWFATGKTLGAQAREIAGGFLAALEVK